MKRARAPRNVSRNGLAPFLGTGTQKNIMPPPPPEPPKRGFTTLFKIDPKRYSIPKEVK